jgi:hypothetical protein
MRPRFDGGLHPDHAIGERIGFVFRDWFERVCQDSNDFELNASELNELRNLAEDINAGKYQSLEYWDQEQTEFLELIAEPNWILSEVIELLDIAPETMRNYRDNGTYHCKIHPQGRWVMPHSEVQRLAREYKPKYRRRDPKVFKNEDFAPWKKQSHKSDGKMPIA